MRVRSVGRRRAAAYARDHRFEVGASVEFDEAAPAPSALEYALAAVAADLVTTFDSLARRERLELDAVEAVATGWLDNPLTVLEVVGEEGHPGLERLVVKLHVVSPAPTERVRALLDRARSLSPLARTLGEALELVIELNLTP